MGATNSDVVKKLLGYRDSGQPIYLAAGGSEDATEVVEETTSEEASEDAGEEGSGSAGESTDGEDSVSRAEYNKLKERMQAADRRATASETERKKLEDAKKDKLQLTEEQRDEAAKAAESAASEIRQLRIQNAFLSDNEFVWHDNSDALRAIESADDIEVDDAGKVTGVKEALRALAKAKPHLVKTEGKASGDAFREKRKGDSKGKPADYSSRFPILAHRKQP